MLKRQRPQKTPNRQKTAKKRLPRDGGSLQNWFLRHLQIMLATLGRLSQTPVSTLMTSTVIGIAVCLPAGMWVMLDNVKQLGGSFDGAASISLFMQTDLPEQQLFSLQEELQNRPEIDSVQLISRDNALAEFRQQSGFAEALDILNDNPLPPVLIITPSEQYSSPENAALLLEQLQQQEFVDLAQLDLEWVKRLQAITDIAFRGVMVLGSVLALAVLLIIGNTIRLEIQNRHAEIEITRLLGATSSFIRRPFLYTGFWYGFLGGVTAWLLVAVSLLLLAGPAEKLTGLYNSGFELMLPGFFTSISMVFGSTALGVAGAIIAVSRHLHAIEPE